LKRPSAILRVFAALVALSLLGAIGYLLDHLTSRGGDGLERVVDAGGSEIRSHLSRGVEPAKENAMVVAAIPWTRDSRTPESVRVEFGSQPFAHRGRGRVAVPLAYLPAMRARHDLERPTPVAVAAAQVPWGRLQSPAELALAAVSVPAADLPSMRIRHNPAKPTDAAVGVAEAPWNRLRVAPVRYLEPAVLPRLTPKRNPQKPDPTAVSPASLPWHRDAQSPLPAYVSAARVPSALRAAAPK
jgi:hypothetical protein